MIDLNDSWRVLEATPESDPVVDAQLFDFFLENGKSEIAHTLIWMRKNRKWPNCWKDSKEESVFYWKFINPLFPYLDDTFTLEKELLEQLPEGIPRSELFRMAYADYSTIRQAIEALAIGLMRCQVITLEDLV